MLVDKLIKIWSFVGKLEGILKGYKLEVLEVVWNLESWFFVLVLDDISVRIWDFFNKVCVIIFFGYYDYVFCCCFNVKIILVVLGLFDESIKIWDVFEGV